MLPDRGLEQFFESSMVWDAALPRQAAAAPCPHCAVPWVLLYTERWLTAPMDLAAGQRVRRDEELRREASLVRYSQTCFCTTLWMRGYAEK